MGPIFRQGPGLPYSAPPLWLPQSSKKRNRKHSGDDSFDEGSVSESESESESGQAEEDKEETGRLHKDGAKGKVG